MRFASQEFFGKLKEAILNDNGDDSIYTELYEVLLHDTRYRIIRNVGFQEWEGGGVGCDSSVTALSDEFGEHA